MPVYGCSNVPYQNQNDYIDECEKKENQCPGPCINSPGSFRCDCNITGFTTSQTTLDHCEDIDECANHNGGCDDVCNNKRGTFECRCETKGRKLGEDGRSCVDVDECSRYKSKVCVNGHCTNTDGSFTCTCNSGYRQARNLSSCEDVNECEANNGGCAQLCENKAGSFSCACHKGFNLADDNINCKDINECLARNGGCDDVCVNKVGFYKCGCSHIGKVLSQDGRSCKECLRTQFFNRSTSTCNSCPQHAHARDALALSVKDCRCDRGFHGNPSLGLECQDVNECQTGDMKCSHKCVNTVGSAYCTCPKGLSAEGDGVTCQDIDECELTTHNCSQLCYNSQGSYTCACQGGYILDKDGQTCNDIDECTKYTTLCSQNCTNTEGGYICECLPGYQLAEDGITCEDLNECLQDESPCEQICTNTVGSFICSCDGIGFKLSRDQTTCIDINECMEGDNPCPNICINTIGSFLCDCDRSGYILASDASGCEDINECSSNPCPHACINTPGSYKCVCPAGFSDPPENNQTVCNECPFGTYRGKEDTSCRRCPPRTNTTSTGSQSMKNCFCVSGYQSDPLGSGLCLDINECTTGALQCEHACVNTEGSAHCTCKPGFLLDPNGVTCKDTNECAKHNGGCEHSCVNSPGSFYCECRGKNYKLAENGLSCEDVNECNLPNHGCEYRCVNSPNGAKCTCPPGHELLEDGKKCKDIDECRSRNGGCTDTCINTPGSYRCECKIPGFKLYTDNKQCVDRNECEEDKQTCEDMCVNTPGSFKCHCRQNGFALASDKRSCEDIDECAKGKICQQVCINLPGSFRCDCEAGFFKQGHHCTACAPGTYRGKKDSVISCQPCPSGMTTTGKATDSILGCFCPAGYHGNPETQDKCEDMNECVKNNGGCQHICNNTNGSFFCSCSEGYILQSDKRKCAPTRCPILNPPKFSKFIGKGCLKMSKGLHADPGTECMYQCRKYMMLHIPERRTCLENFTWSGKDPECLARPCERLPVPENGYLYPNLCMLPRVPFRTRCIYKCNRGYESVGKPGAKCKANNKWSGKGQHHCVAKRRKRNG